MLNFLNFLKSRFRTGASSLKSKAIPLIQTNEGKLFAIAKNRRRPVLYANVLTSYPKNAFAPPQPDPKGAYADLPLGPPVPFKWTLNDWLDPPRNNKILMRQIIVSRLAGSGVEFGAGARPLPIPLTTSVTYSEAYFTREQMVRMYGESAYIMIPDLNLSFDNQRDILPGSLDWIGAAHVIEHTRNPIKAIADSYRSLRVGGQLVLIVPDRRYTFDRVRPVTPLAHLIEDYEQPSDDRDFEHYLEFATKVKRSKSPEADARKAAAEGLDTHFHVWDDESFDIMIQYIRSKIAPFSEVYFQPRVDDKACLEFYFVLTK